VSSPVLPTPTTRGPDPLDPDARRRLMEAERPRSLKLAPVAAPGKRNLPLAPTVRAVDAVRPIYAVWELTLACDLACRHCGSRAGKARPDELSTDECLDLVRQLAELGVKEVSLIGGEAYLRDDWILVIEAIRRHGMLANLTTGGRGMTPERARAAYAAGLRDASISLDGLEATHDRLRGVPGSFRSALAAMENLRAAGVTINNNTQVNRLTMPDLPELLELMIERGSRAWQIQLTVPMGRVVDEPDILLQPYDLLDLFPIIPRLKARADQAGFFIWRGNSLGYFGPYESLISSWMPDSHGTGCGAGRTIMGIEANGIIKGCPSLTTDKWASGNIRDASLKDIWERGGPIRYTRDRTVDDLWGFCRSCYYADTCRAGCTWMTETLLGKPGNNPFCHHRALEMQKAGKRERVERVEEASGKPFDAGRFRLVVEEISEASAPAPAARGETS